MALSIMANIGAFIEGCFTHKGTQRSMEQRFPSENRPLLTKGA